MVNTVVKILLLASIASSFLATGAFSAESVNVPSDSSANYGIVVRDVGFGREALIVISKRDGSSGTSYSIREVNCNNQTFRYMGEGDTLEEAMDSLDDKSKMSPLVEGSISYYIVRAACD